MNPGMAALLGVVEGLTEYLPVSSTGHLILFSHFAGIEGEADKSFDIVIQLGAILAVVVHYRALLASRVAGFFARDHVSVTLFLALAAGFVPTAVAGLLLRKAIKRLLFGPVPVAAALIVGGVLMIVLERALARRAATDLDGLEHVTPLRGFLIGLGQCIS